jgi:hypothetical protein
MSIGGSLLGVKCQDRITDYLPPSCTKLWNAWNLCGDLLQCKRRYRIGAEIHEPRRQLDSALPSDSWQQTYKKAALQCNQYRPFGPDQSQPVTTSYQPLLHPRVNSTATCPAIAGRQEARLLAEPAWALPAGANLRSASFTAAATSLSSANNARSQSAAAYSTRSHSATIPARDDIAPALCHLA